MGMSRGVSVSLAREAEQEAAVFWDQEKNKGIDVVVACHGGEISNVLSLSCSTTTTTSMSVSFCRCYKNVLHKLSMPIFYPNAGQIFSSDLSN
jgi:hypothetical protein